MVILTTIVVSYNFYNDLIENSLKLRITLIYVELVIEQNYEKNLVILYHRDKLIKLVNKFKDFIIAHPKPTTSDLKFLRIQLKGVTLIVTSMTFLLALCLTIFSYIYSMTTGNLEEPYMTASKLPGTE